MKQPQIPRTWFVVRTRAGLERTALVKVMKAGFEAYLPRRRLERFNRQQRVLTETEPPLLPGYMFVRQPAINETADNWPRLNKCDGVMGPLMGDVGELAKPLPIPDIVVHRLQTDEFDGAYDERKSKKATKRAELNNRFVTGAQFRITDGPFASFVAEIDHLTPQNRVKALVTIFGRLVEVDLEPDQMEREPEKPGRRAA